MGQDVRGACSAGKQCGDVREEEHGTSRCLFWADAGARDLGCAPAGKEAEPCRKGNSERWSPCPGS